MTGIWSRMKRFAGVLLGARTQDKEPPSPESQCTEAGQRTSQPALPEGKGSPIATEGSDAAEGGKQGNAESRTETVSARVRRRTPVEIVVGLDFGTSTVKCVVQTIVGERRRRERHVLPVQGELLFPSLAWEQDGVVTFGRSPRGAARCYRSAKVCLRCSVLREEPCRQCFAGSKLTAETVAWGLLSNCVQSIRAQLDDLFPQEDYALDWDHGVEWKMGVPLDGLEQRPLRDLFADLLWHAVHSGDGIGAAVGCDELCERYGALGAQHCPSTEESNCFVVAEADVAVNAFLEAQRNIEDGLYFLSDVGAGTVDVAFFRFAQKSERPIIFYGTSSTRVGVDDLALSMARRLMETNRRLSAAKAWNKAHDMLARVLTAGDGHIHKCVDCARDFQGVYSLMHQGFRRAFSRALSKERVWDRWKGLKGAVIGGGRPMPGVADVFFKPISYGNPNEVIKAAQIPLRIAPIEGATELHGIAYGLSVPFAEYFEHWRPGDVPEMERNHTRFSDVNRHVDFHDYW